MIKHRISNEKSKDQKYSISRLFLSRNDLGMTLSRRYSYKQYYRRTYNTHAPRTSHKHSTKPKSAMMKTHQIKLSQSCRKYRAVKAGDLVALLCMKRTRQMHRRNKINHATSAQHKPLTSQTHTTKTKSAMMKTYQIKHSQSCREYRAIKADDLVDLLRMTSKRQMHRRNNINHATSAQHAPRTSHTHTTKYQSLQ